jgi:hypothetical protein
VAQLSTQALEENSEAEFSESRSLIVIDLLKGLPPANPQPCSFRQVLLTSEIPDPIRSSGVHTSGFDV